MIDGQDRRRTNLEPGLFPPVRSSRVIAPQEVLDALDSVEETVTVFERALIASRAFMPACVPLAATPTLAAARLYWLPSEGEGARVVIRRGALGDDAPDDRAPQRLATAYLPDVIRAFAQLPALANAAEIERQNALRLPAQIASLIADMAWRTLSELDRAMRVTDLDDDAANLRSRRDFVFFDLCVPPEGHRYFREDGEVRLIREDDYPVGNVARAPDRVALDLDGHGSGYARLATLDENVLNAVLMGKRVALCGEAGGVRYYCVGRSA